MGSQLRIESSSTTSTVDPSSTQDSQIFNILENPRMNETAKVAALEKSIANLSDSEKLALFERLKDKKSQDPLAREFHYRLSHHSGKAGQLSSVDHILNALKPAPSTESSSAKDSQSAKASSPSVVDSKTADTLARDRIAKPAPPVNPEVLPAGESISAKVTSDSDILKPQAEITFDFSRPLNKEQAAAI